jgi:uncharacterized protein (DUF433 family)
MIIGKPVKAKWVASMHVKAGAPIEEIMEHYHLSRAEVHSALAYYYDNQEAIEQEFRDAEVYVKEFGISSQELIARMRARREKT